MKIAISGATGFIGTHLSDYLVKKGHEVIKLGREWFREEVFTQLIRSIAEVDVVINLAGATINRRWTEKYKQQLRDSRIIPTQMLVEAINQTERVQLFISASAVGYYSSQGCHDEYTGIKGDDFLAGLCEAWETEAKRVRPSVRLVITRFGVVLSLDGGAFRQLIRPLHWGIAAVIHTGNQLFTWIDLLDLMEAMEFIIHHPELRGIFNFVTPGQITNADFTHALAQYYHAMFQINIPSVFFRLLYGEGAGFLLRGQCVEPVRLLSAGFQFRTTTIQAFLKDKR